MPQKDGATLRDHLATVYKQTGRPPKELEGPDIAEWALYLWEWFRELSAGRGSTGFGPAPLTYSEIKAWMDMKKITIEPWELTILKRLDSVYLTQTANRKT